MPAQPERTCPYLGLSRDPSTHMGYPSDENICLKWNHPIKPSVSHQEHYCLQPVYVDCPIYQSLKENPDQEESGRKIKIRPALIIAAGMIASLVLLGMAHFSFRAVKPQSLDLTLSSQPSSEGFPVITDASNLLKTGDITATFAILSATPDYSTTNNPSNPILAGSSTADPLPYGFDVTRIPGNTSQVYIVHVIEPGESLNMLAIEYDTTVEVLLLLNYKLKTPIWVNSRIVIPVGVTETAGLPRIEVFVVTEYDSITADFLAKSLNVDLQDIINFNNCRDTCQFKKGDVVLVPHSQ